MHSNNLEDSRSIPTGQSVYRTSPARLVAFPFSRRAFMDNYRCPSGQRRALARKRYPHARANFRLTLALVEIHRKLRERLTNRTHSKAKLQMGDIHELEDI